MSFSCKQRNEFSRAEGVVKVEWGRWNEVTYDFAHESWNVNKEHELCNRHEEQERRKAAAELTVSSFPFSLKSERSTTILRRETSFEWTCIEWIWSQCGGHCFGWWSKTIWDKKNARRRMKKLKEKKCRWRCACKVDSASSPMHVCVLVFQCFFASLFIFQFFRSAFVCVCFHKICLFMRRVALPRQRQ